jgi:pimeloyl-ACP methyl ester carboxylesterase
MVRPAPVPIPPWADTADIDYAVAEFERTGFHRPLNYYRSLQAVFDLGKVYRGLTLHQAAFFLTGEADGVNAMRPVDEAALRRDVPGLRGVRILPDVGLWVHREAPAATGTLLIEFMRGLD